MDGAARAFARSRAFQASLATQLAAFARGLHPQVQTVAGSKRIGMRLEVRVREALLERFGFAAVEDTSGIPEAMDVRVSLPAVADLPARVVHVECKNVSTANVGTRDLQKFERDAAALPGAAILLARHRVDVRGGYSRPVPGVPNLRRASRRVYYVERGDLDALSVAVFLAWGRPAGPADVPEWDGGGATPATNLVLEFAADALARQKELVAGIHGRVKAFLGEWHTRTRGLADALVELREISGGRVLVEPVFAALTYRAAKPSVKKRRR